MAEGAQTKVVGTKPSKTTPFMQRIISYVLLALVFFLLGFLPLWFEARGTAARLAETEQSLRLAQLENSLGAAVINAQRGEYEPALQSVSSFYTALQAELDRGAASAFSPAEQTALQPMFSERDALIALLAREDPAAAPRLSELYRSYHQILAGEAEVEAQPTSTP